MITIHTGNMLEVPDGILVHGCNCQGVMGSGIAGQIRAKWPQVFIDYKNWEESYGLNLGQVIYTRIKPLLVIASALTQDDCGNDKSIQYADYDAIDVAFQWIKVMANNSGLPVHFPLIGCGLANGKWEEVAPLIEKALGPDINANLWLYPGK